MSRAFDADLAGDAAAATKARAQSAAADERAQKAFGAAAMAARIAAIYSTSLELRNMHYAY